MAPTDNELIKRAQRGDMTAFELLLYRYDRHVLNIAYSFRNSEDDAKDIYQEVFMRVYRGLKNFQFRSEFSTWLYRIATNVCITYQRQKKRHTHESIDRELTSNPDESLTGADLLEGDSSADEAALGSDISEHVQDALQQLPPQQKMAFTLKYFQEYKIKEIAEMMNCAEGTVKRYLFNASQKMKTQLKPVLQR